MKTLAVIAATMILGLSAPVSAHAQILDRVGRILLAAAEEPQPPGRANQDKDRDQDERPAQQPRLVPLNQVIAQISRQTPGRLLDASPPDPGSARPVYRIRWQANSGQRIDFVVDAQSGAIISRSGG